MVNMRRGFAMAASVAALAAFPAGASAEKEAFAVTCNGVEYMVTTGNGNWAVAQSVDRRTHFIPKSFDFTVTDASGKVVFTEHQEKKGHRNQQTVTCTFSDQFTEDGETFTFTGTAEVVQKPERKR